LKASQCLLLSYYATQFNTVELAYTFYRTPSASTVEGRKMNLRPLIPRGYFKQRQKQSEFVKLED